MGLVRGNSKLGNIWTWSIPAIHTCPGRTNFCEDLCYAAGGFFRMPSTIQFQRENLRQARLKRFSAYVLRQIDKYDIRLLRVHASGDFFDVDYTNKWMDIFRVSAARTKFWLYTRSWRIRPELRGRERKQAEQLRDLVFEMTQFSNVTVFLSADKETGRPPRWPRTRIAYLMGDDSDRPRYKPDLYFRDDTKTVMQLEPTSGVLVCPVEQGVDREVKITCERCGLCYRPKQLDQLNERNRLRIVESKSGVSDGSEVKARSSSGRLRRISGKPGVRLRRSSVRRSAV